MLEEQEKLQIEEKSLREGGATMEDVLDHLQREKALEEETVHSWGPTDRRRLPNTAEKTMSAVEMRSENLLKHYQKLLEEEEHVTDPGEKLFLSEEKLSILHEFNNLAVHILYTEMSEYSSQDPEAAKIKSEIREVFDNEMAQIKEGVTRKTDPGTLALIRTRSAELEKMKIELEIRWIEKKMWDLQVEWSPEKETLSKELQTITNERLNPAILEYVSALHNERDILLKREGTPERSTSLAYINGRLIEFERVIKENLKA